MHQRDAKYSIKVVSLWREDRSILDVSIWSEPGAGCRAMGQDDLEMLMLITDQTESDTDGALAAPLWVIWL